MNKIRPKSDVIIVKQHEEETKTASGIVVIYEENQKKSQGTVIAVGPGEILTDGTRRPMEIKVGEVVVFGEYAGQKWKYKGEDYLVMRERDIICGFVSDEVQTRESAGSA